MKNLNYASPINATGYGVASLNILKALLAENINISYFPIGNPNVTNQEDYDILYPLAQSNGIFDINAPYLKIWHQFDLAQHAGKGPYYAYPFFELDLFNDLEKLHMSIPDALFVSSRWAQDIIRQNGITTKTHVVPLGVDTKIFDYQKYQEHNKASNSKYVFLTIGKWEVRKGHDILPTIFSKAFPKETDVELWVMAATHTNTYSSKEEIEKWHSMYSFDARIKVLNGVPTHEDVARVISMSDCGLYVARAEGWNLELLETMAMNKPAIATNYSAHTEFCNKDNCYLVDIDETEKAYDGKVFRGQGNWAKITNKQVDQIIDYMRAVYSSKQKTNLAGLETANKFSWTNSAQEIIRCIYS